ncbi:MAG: superoxide dismutase family protein [Xanthobacteraceae bacterium]|nr:superoxide dismutase family protein [Xanthobacteraceae bacterium]
MFLRTVLAAVLMSTVALTTASADTAKATFKNADGAVVGHADLMQATNGVLIQLTLKGLPPGGHAFHVHAVGKCEPPFTSAGGHFNPQNHKHGIMASEGAHAGDMPNLTIPASGELKLEILNPAVTLAKGAPNSLLKPDGTALVIHATVDDYKSDPAGNAGGRIACAVVEP